MFLTRFNFLFGLPDSLLSKLNTHLYNRFDRYVKKRLNEFNLEYHKLHVQIISHLYFIINRN